LSPSVAKLSRPRSVRTDHLSLVSFIPQLENARAVIDLYRSVELDCEVSVAVEDWPFHLPPENFSRCYS